MIFNFSNYMFDFFTIKLSSYDCLIKYHLKEQLLVMIDIDTLSL